MKTTTTTTKMQNEGRHRSTSAHQSSSELRYKSRSRYVHKKSYGFPSGDMMVIGEGMGGAMMNKQRRRWEVVHIVGVCI